MRACELGHDDIVVSLLDARACTEYRDPAGWTPLCHALGNGEVSIARILVSRMEKAKRQHKELVHHLRSELLESCEANAGEDAALEVTQLLDHPDILSMTDE